MVKKQREREREKESEQTVVDVAKGVGREGWPPLPDGGGEHEARGLGGLWLLLALVSSKGWVGRMRLVSFLPVPFVPSPANPRPHPLALLAAASRARPESPAAPQFSRAGESTEHRAVSGTDIVASRWRPVA